MADDSYSSLRQAIEKIIGAPAGGVQGASDIMELAPRTPYSQDLRTAAPRAQDVSVSNAPDAATQAATQQAAAAAAPAAVAAPVSTAASAPLMPDYKSYHEYYAGNPEALSRSNYIGKGTTGEGGRWGEAGNPYRYRNEYSKYLATLPTEYQALGKSNITGEAVKKGAITGVYDPVTKQTYSVGPNVKPGTVLPGSAPAAAAPAAPRKPPVNPGPGAPWQKSQQYWKDLAAYKGM